MSFQKATIISLILLNIIAAQKLYTGQLKEAILLFMVLLIMVFMSFVMSRERGD